MSSGIRFKNTTPHVLEKAKVSAFEGTSFLAEAEVPEVAPQGIFVLPLAPSREIAADVKTKRVSGPVQQILMSKKNEFELQRLRDIHWDVTLKSSANSAATVLVALTGPNSVLKKGTLSEDERSAGGARFARLVFPPGEPLKVFFQEVGAVCDILTQTKFFLPWLLKQQADKNATMAFKLLETIAKDDKHLTEALDGTRERRQQLTEKQNTLMTILEALGKTAAPDANECKTRFSQLPVGHSCGMIKALESLNFECCRVRGV